MNRRLAGSRARFAALAVAHGSALFGAGALVPALLSQPAEVASFAVKSELVFLIVVTQVVVRAFVLAQLPDAVRNAHWQILRPLACWEATGLAGAILGAATNPGLIVAWPLFLITSALICPLSIAAARGGASPLPARPASFFLFARGHIADWSARRHLAGIIVLAGLAGALLQQMIHSEPGLPAPLPDALLEFGLGLIPGLMINLLQRNSTRSVGLVVPALLILALAALGHGGSPEALWPALLLGLAAGMLLAAFGACLLMHVLPRHRFAAVLLADGCAAAAAAAGWRLSSWLPEGTADWLIFVLALLAFDLFQRLYFREFAELMYEVVFWPLYRFEVRGPGSYSVPTRGPTLTIANHAAYFDPLYLCKVLPLGRIRAMMISTFLDRPFLSWLAGDVYEAIRVPESGGFRRQAPELDEAVAALKNGEHVMIFPEGWLRRKEDQPIRRFAQGVYRILSQVPDTVVLPCWIETSWGSYLSFKGGPPTRNKKFDWWYRIVYAAGEPVVLPPEMLKDAIATRRHLMELVAGARAYLDLPPHPLPPFGASEKEE
jgi:1-acyl-sn-glycerol-3-phosphate acyltransferase